MTRRRVMLRTGLAVVALAATASAAFECPESTGVFADPEQCDKYWVCQGGRPTRTLCQDGLAFHPRKEDGEDPCDLIHNVPDRCKRRTKLQRAQPGDAHCPRQSGVYKSEDPGECDVFFTCRLGVGIPTKCSEGLHYSEEVGTCVWARDSGRIGCGVEKEPVRKKKKKAQQQSASPTPKKKEVSPRLDNGFVCPGGKLGVHIALPHPTDCRKFYTCLDGLTPRSQGCPVSRVFNPTTSSCDEPTNVVGCETYYDSKRRPNPPPVSQVVRPSPREEPRQSEGLAGGEFSGFLAQLEKHGLLKPGALDALKNVMREEVGRQEVEEERMVGAPTGNRLSLSEIRGKQRDTASRTLTSTEASEPVKPLTTGSRSSLFNRRVPPKRRNKFTGFIPRVKPVGNIENIHPVGLIKEEFLETEKEMVNVIPSSEPTAAALAELESSDNEVLKNIVAAILSEGSTTSTTQATSTEAATRGRKRFRPGGNLFNPEGRRANSIFNRSRTRQRLASTTSTTQSSTEVEDNLVEENERSRPTRLRGFRRPRPRPRFRPQGRVRAHLQEEAEEQQLEEMLEGLAEGSPLKEEFEKFMKEQLAPGTGPRRFRPSGNLNRSKLRGLIARTKLRNQLQEEEEVEEVKEEEPEEIKTSMKSSTESSTTVFAPTVEPIVTTVTSTTTTTTTTTVTTTTTTTTISTTAPTTTTTTTLPPTTISTTTLREEVDTTLFIPTAPPQPSRPSLATLPAVPTVTNLVQVDATAPGLEDYGDQPFEYVYYEYYYDYEYEDDLTGPSATGPSGTGPSASGPSAIGPSASGPGFLGPSAFGNSATELSETGPSAIGPNGPGFSLGPAELTGPGASTGPGPIIGPAERPDNVQRFSEPRNLPQTVSQEAFNSPPSPPVKPVSFLQEAPRTFQPETTQAVPPPPRSRPLPTNPRGPPSGPRGPPSPPRPQPPSLTDSSRFPHFQNFKPIDPLLDPPAILPPPPRRLTFEEPEQLTTFKQQQRREKEEEEKRRAETEVRRKEVERQKKREKQKKLEQQRIQEQLAFQAREEEERSERKKAERQRQRERQELELQKQREAEKRFRAEKEKKQKEKEERKKAKAEEQERQFQKELALAEAERQRGAPSPARPQPQFPTSQEEVAGPTTFGPFSAFRNFPQFPRGQDTEGGLQNTDFITAPLPPNSGELRGPNLLPTRPTGQPLTLPPGGSQEVRRPPGPPPTGPEDPRFRPPPPQRPPAPPVTVFAPSQTPPRPPSPPPKPTGPPPPTPKPVLIPSGPLGSAIPQGAPPPGSTFQDQFFNIQTQLGQTNTRIPPNTRAQGLPNQSPFTFFNQQQFKQQQNRVNQQNQQQNRINQQQNRANQQPRQKSGPVSFPTEVTGLPNRPSKSNLPLPTGPNRPGLGNVVNNNIVHDPNAQSSSFFSFNSNNFQRGAPTAPEQPRTIQSVFGPGFQSPFSSGSNFFNGGGRGQPTGQRFESRPTPNSRGAPSQLQERPSPPLTVFNLPASTQRLSQQPQSPAPTFPSPQFGGFSRPIKRSGVVLPGEEDLFAEELSASGSRRNTRRTSGKKDKKKGRKNNKKGSVGTRRSGGEEEKTNKKKSGKQKKKKEAKETEEEEAARSSREQMQAALKAELARVYFEEFARSKDNEVDFDYDDGSGSGDYYYYYYYDDYFE